MKLKNFDNIQQVYEQIFQLTQDCDDAESGEEQARDCEAVEIFIEEMETRFPGFKSSVGI